MEHQILTEQLRELMAEEYTWNFSLYKSKKNKDGYCLEFFGCQMNHIASFVDDLRETLLTKTIVERSVMPYTPFLPVKEVIGAVETSDPMIKEALSDVMLAILDAYDHVPDEFSSGELPSMTGYAFYGRRENEQDQTVDQVLLIRRTNPVLTSPSKIRLCVGGEKELSESAAAIFKFPKTVDLLVIGGVCYFLTEACQKDLGMESRYLAICAKNMAAIAESEIVTDYDQFESVAMSNKHARKFVDFDQDILDHIVGLPELERAEFLDRHGITLDEQGRMETYDPEQCELIVDLLCCRSCHDALGRLAVGSNIIPR